MRAPHLHDSYNRDSGGSPRRTSVRTKKTNKPTRSIRYLLSANPRFQRISLRRLSAPLKNAKKRPREERSTAPARARLAFVLVAIFIAALGVLMTARGQSRRADVATAAAAQLQATPRVDANARAEAGSKPDKAETTVRRDTSTTVAATTPDAPLAAAKHAADASVGKTPVAEPVKTSVAESTVKGAPVPESPFKTPAAELTAKPLAIDSMAKADVQSSSPATITGCLRLDEETFWLTETTGEDAPKSRSWKWGFLKKRSSNIALLDAPSTLKLPNYVGQRITATGALSKRGMQAHSLQRVAASCN